MRCLLLNCVFEVSLLLVRAVPAVKCQIGASIAKNSCVYW